MRAIEEILARFDPISLSEIAGATLMERSEMKYAFLKTQLPGFLEQVSKDYKVLEVNHSRLNPYETIYFDTSDYYLYFQHHNSRYNRYKIRKRLYTASGDCFLEIKHKTNKNKTLKNRTCIENIEEHFDEDNYNYIKENTTLDIPELMPKLWVYFSRITLVNKNGLERLTLDVNIRFKNGGRVISYPKIAIAEIKQEVSSLTPFCHVMRKSHVHTGSISKYCLGLISTKDNIKMNNFKHKLQLIKKLYSEK